MQAHSSLISPNADTPLDSFIPDAQQLESYSPDRLSELSHSEREAAIRVGTRLVAKHAADHKKYLQDYDITNDFGDKGLADRSRLLAEEAAGWVDLLIKGRRQQLTEQGAHGE